MPSLPWWCFLRPLLLPCKRGETLPSAVVHEAGLHASIEKDLEGLMANKSHGELLVN